MRLKEQFQNTNWFSRKFIMSIALEILVTLLLFGGVVKENTWAETTRWIWIVYGGANALSKHKIS